MNIQQLIELAAESVGSKGELASRMGKAPARISEWMSGKQKPDAHEVAYLAECAGLPVLETVADIESQLDERYSEIWKAALGKLRAAGVAASWILILQLAQTPQKANANQALSQTSTDAQIIYIVAKTLRRLAKALRARLVYLVDFIIRPGQPIQAA